MSRSAPSSIAELTQRISRAAASVAGGQADPETYRIHATLRMELDQAKQRALAAPASKTDRLEHALRRAERAEEQVARLKGRRAIRLSEALGATSDQPWNVAGLARRLAAAFKTGPQPRPGPSAIPDDQLSSNWAVGPYPQLRIAHAGRLEMFDGLAPHIDVAGLSESNVDGFDMLLLEPGHEDDLADASEQLLAAFSATGTPIVFVARTSAHLDCPQLEMASLVVTTDPDLDAPDGALVIAPSVDPRIHNPVGWQRQPTQGLVDCNDLLDKSSIELAAAVKSARVATTARADEALECLAAGTPLVALADPEFDALLGEHYLAAGSQTEMEHLVDRMGDLYERERTSIRARRHVLTRHNRLRRLEEILARLSIPLNPPSRISVLVATMRPERLEAAVASVTKQDWPDVELVLSLHHQEKFDSEQVNDVIAGLPYPVKVVRCPSSLTLGDCLNRGLHVATGDYIAKMDDDDEYGAQHLTDLHTAFTYAGAEVVGKLSNVTYLTESDVTIDWRIDDQERMVHHIPGATMLIRRELLDRYRFNRVNRGVDSSLWERLVADGHRLFSTHRFNFIRVRHGDHTYVRPDSDFLALATTPPEPGLDPTRWHG